MLSSGRPIGTTPGTSRPSAIGEGRREGGGLGRAVAVHHGQPGARPPAPGARPRPAPHRRRSTPRAARRSSPASSCASSRNSPAVSHSAGHPVLRRPAAAAAAASSSPGGATTTRRRSAAAPTPRRWRRRTPAASAAAPVRARRREPAVAGERRHVAVAHPHALRHAGRPGGEHHVRQRCPGPRRRRRAARGRVSRSPRGGHRPSRRQAGRRARLVAAAVRRPLARGRAGVHRHVRRRPP